MGGLRILKYCAASPAIWLMLHNRCDAANIQKRLLEDKRLFATEAAIQPLDTSKTTTQTSAYKGPAIIDFEAKGSKATPAQIAQAKKTYSNFLDSAIVDLKGAGFKNPKTEAELLQLVNTSLLLVWSKFKYPDNGKGQYYLLYGMLTRKIDCDLSAYVVGDILSNFGASCWIAVVEGHAILKASLPPTKAIYIETTYDPSSIAPLLALASDLANFQKSISNSSISIEIESSPGNSMSLQDFLKLLSSVYCSSAEVEKEYGPIESETQFASLPEAPYLYCLRGQSYDGMKNYSQAIADYTNAIKLDPDDLDPYCKRGLAYCQMKNYEKAIADFTSAIKLGPNGSDLYYNRGCAHYYLQDYAEAIADFTSAIKLSPKDPNSYYNRGVAYSNLAAQDSKKADSLAAANQGKPSTGYAASYFKNGTAYLAQAKYQDAFIELSAALALNPFDMDAYLKRSEACNKLSGADLKK